MKKKKIDTLLGKLRELHEKNVKGTPPVSVELKPTKKERKKINRLMIKMMMGIIPVVIIAYVADAWK